MKPVTSIKKFKEGAKVQGFFLCTEKHLRHTRSGDLYLDVTLRDQTGQINAKIWDKVAELNDLFSSGDAVISKLTEKIKPRLIQGEIKNSAYLELLGWLSEFNQLGLQNPE